MDRYVPARAHIVANGWYEAHDGILDNDTGLFAYYRFVRNVRVPAVAGPDGYVKVTTDV